MAIERDLTDRTVTTNYELIEPQYDETADIMDINYNMEQIDAAMHGIQGDADKAVKYTEQSLTSEQKAQARTNIGLTVKDASQSTSAGGGNGLVYNVSNNTMAVIFCFGASGLCGRANVYCDASGNVSASNDVQDMIISKTVPDTANKLWIKNNNGDAQTCYMKMLIFAGDIYR